MNRAQRRAVARLPTALEAWEAVFLHDPATLGDGSTIEGVLLVCESRSGNVRAGGPVTPADQGRAVVLLACSDPVPPCAASRPRAVVCADGRTRALLERAGLDDVRLSVGKTPHADEALDAMRRELASRGPPPIPGVSEDLEVWRETLTTLARHAPWRTWPPNEPVRFVGEAVLERGALWVSVDGQSIAVSFSPTGRSPGDAADACWFLLLDPLSELDRSELAAARDGGWVLPGALVPSVFGGVAPLAGPLAQADERRFLAALRAVALLAGAPGATARTADTALGRVEARRTRTPVPAQCDEVVRGDAKFALWQTEPPRLVIRQRKADGARTALALAGLTEVGADLRDGILRLVARGSGGELGHLVDVDEHDPGPRMRVTVVQGGARGTHVREADVLFDREVPIVKGGASRPRVVLDPVFRGPPDRWPKASAVLGRMMEEVLGPATAWIPDAAFEGMATLAATVFSSVSRADHAGDDTLLRDTRRALGGEPQAGTMIDQLIDAKRRLFAGDPRIMKLDRVERTKDERILWVTSAVPGGLPPPSRRQ